MSRPPLPRIKTALAAGVDLARGRARAARMVVVAALFVSAAILAGCTLPSQTSTTGPASLEPIHDDIPGLTPEHERSHPSALHITADGRLAYVALPGTIARPDDRVIVVDLETGKREDTIRVGVRPLALVADPAAPERLVVTHPYTNALTVIDTERRIAVHQIPAPFYLEQAAFSPDGSTFVATDRALDRLVVYDVTRGDRGLELKEVRSIPTGPNPEHVVFVDNPNGGNSTLVAVGNRHGASIEIADIATGNHRRVAVGGPPLALASHDGLVFVAGLGPGNGGNTSKDGSTETGTADIENSLFVVDVRAGAAVVNQGGPTVPTLRYVSDTARADRALDDLRVLAGATPRALVVDGNDTLWVTYQGSDQVQRLRYHAPQGETAITTSLLTTASGTAGTRLSHLDADTPLTPGRLGDTVHGVYETPPGPRATLRQGDLLVTVAELSEQLQVIDLSDCPGARAPQAACTHKLIDLVADPVPYPSGTYEEGERLFVSALPSADQDRSCASCHMDGLSTAQTWTLPHRPETPLLIPRLDQVARYAPWLHDGSATTPGDYAKAAGGDMLRPDPEDPWNLERTNASAPDAAFSRRTAPLVADVANATAWFERTFAYSFGELRILPTPPAVHERAASNKGAADKLTGANGCFSCHMPDASTVLSSDRSEEIPRPPGSDRLKARPLGGIWDRNGTAYLHDGGADTILEALLPHGHACLDGSGGQPVPWHGVIDHYKCNEIRAVIDHLEAYRTDA